MPQAKICDRTGFQMVLLYLGIAGMEIKFGSCFNIAMPELDADVFQIGAVFQAKGGKHMP